MRTTADDASLAPSKIIVNLDHLPKDPSENEQCLKPLPRYIIEPFETSNDFASQLIVSLWLMVDGSEILAMTTWDV